MLPKVLRWDYAHPVFQTLCEPRNDRVDVAIHVAAAFCRDPLHDHLTGASFEVSAGGSQRDSIISNDTNTDGSWDAVWDAAVSIDDDHDLHPAEHGRGRGGAGGGGEGVGTLRK